jgi:hypothetical protein
MTVFVTAQVPTVSVLWQKQHIYLGQLMYFLSPSPPPLPNENDLSFSVANIASYECHFMKHASNSHHLLSNDFKISVFLDIIHHPVFI